MGDSNFNYIISDLNNASTKITMNPNTMVPRFKKHFEYIFIMIAKLFGNYVTFKG